MFYMLNSLCHFNVCVVFLLNISTVMILGKSTLTIANDIIDNSFGNIYMNVISYLIILFTTIHNNRRPCRCYV